MMAKKNKERSPFHRQKSVKTETIYLDDTWRLTEDKVKKTFKIFGLRVFKDEQELEHTLRDENVFTSSKRTKNVGFSSNED